MRRHQQHTSLEHSSAEHGDSDIPIALANELRMYRQVIQRAAARLPWRRLRQTLAPWLLALVLLVGPNSPLALANPSRVMPPAQGTAQSAGSAPRGTTSTPNTFGAYLKQLHATAAQPRHIAQASAGGPVVKAGTTKAPTPLQRPFRPSMQTGTMSLTPGQAAHFTSSDGALQISVPAGAVSTADVAAAGGALALRIDQVAPSSGATAGGSGEISLGMYLVQVVTAQGTRAPFGLRQPITVTLTYGKRELAANLDHSFLVVDGPRPVNLPLLPLASVTPSVTPSPTASATPSVTPSPTAAVSKATPSPTSSATASAMPSPTSSTTPSAVPSASAGGKATPSPTASAAPSPTASAGSKATPSPTATAGHGSRGTATGSLGAIAAYPTTHDATRHTLTGVVPLTSAATLDFNTFASVGTFGAPDPFTTDLSGGGLTSDIPIDVPSGPGGLTPPIHLSYSSAAVSEQHNVQGAAGWVGEGWSMSLGSITWAEHDVTADCPQTCGENWENSWQISDPFGMGADLIPPNNAVSTYYDETTNTYYDGTNYDNMPAQWHTSAENYAKIISYVGPNTIQTQAARPPCFRAWLTNGIMEEFGCTPDALEYYETRTGDRMTAWYLDLITDPAGNQNSHHLPGRYH